MLAPTKGSYEIYLDHNSTTFTSKEVLEEMLPFFDQFYGNPSNVHYFGVKTNNAITAARRLVAGLLGATAEEIYFTSGGTESNNLALFGYLEKFRGTPIHVITSSIEHPSINEVCRKLMKRGDVEVTFIPVNTYGRIDMKTLENSIKENTKLISIMAVNNIIGTIQDLDKIGLIAKKHDIIFHSDGVQAAGKIPLDIKKCKIDMLSLSSHKIYGPKGVGALFVRDGVKIESLIFGGGQEYGLRSGTENVPGIIGVGKASYIAQCRLDDFHAHTLKLRTKFVQLAKKEMDNIYVLSHERYCVPSTLNISFKDIKADTIVRMLSYYGIGASSCAACAASHRQNPEGPETAGGCQVLESLDLSYSLRQGAVRFSFGFGVTEKDIENTVMVLKMIIEKLRMIKG